MIQISEELHKQVSAALCEAIALATVTGRMEMQQKLIVAANAFDDAANPTDDDSEH